MSSGKKEIYYLFNIVVAAVACGAFAIGIINHRAIQDKKKEIGIIDKKIEEVNNEILETKGQLAKIIDSQHESKRPLKHRQNKTKGRSKISDRKVKKIIKENRIGIKVKKIEKEQKKRTLDLIVSDLVDLVVK